MVGDELLGLPVRSRGIELGRPVDLVVDLERGRVLGLEVRCGDGAHRFLPLAAAHHRDGELAIRSALLLLDEPEGSFYRRRARRLRELRGGAVARGRRRLGTLADLVLGDEGAVTELLLEQPRTRLAFSTGLTFTPRSAAPAA
jgi:sporulation protein YlmC with PRC-barrel domain